MESVEDMEEVDLHNVISGTQFWKAQEDEELRGIRTQILKIGNDQPEGNARTP